MLDANRYKINTVEQYLLAATAGPYEHDGFVKPTAHHLAWGFAHHLWLGIYLAVNEEEFHDGGSDFQIDRERLDTRWEPIRDKLRLVKPIDVHRFSSIIQIESAKAEAAADKALPDEYQGDDEATNEPKATTDSASKPVGKRKCQQGPPLRSWTQTDLDEEIRKYKASRARSFSDMAAGIKAGKAGARKSAREVFGRNAVARKLGVKAPAMVSKSPVWQEIADELRLRRPSKTGGSSPLRRIGIDIAVEEKAAMTSEPVVDQIVREETIRLVTKTMPEAAATATVEKLVHGEISDDKARELIEIFAAQSQDDRTHIIRQTL